MPQSQARLAPAQYSFAPASKQITFAGVPGFVLDGLIEVLHVASGNVLYDAYDPTLGGTASGNVLTLAFDTTGTYGSGTAYNAADALRIIYNDLTREDQLLVYTPTATGVFATIPLRGYQSLVLDIISGTSIQVQVEVSVDGTNWKTGTGVLTGRLPNLYNNSGSQNADQGTPFNTRQYDVSAFRWIRLNATTISAGTPTVNVLLKTTPAPTRDIFIQGGALGVSLNGSTAQIGYIGVGQNFQEAFRSTLAANGVLTGSSRDTLFNPLAYNRFGALVVSDQSGTVQLQFSTDNTNWIPATLPVAVTGGTPLDISAPIRARWCRAVFTNGATATGTNAFTLLTSFLGA